MKKNFYASLRRFRYYFTFPPARKATSRLVTYETEALPDSVDPLIASNDTELTILYNILSRCFTSKATELQLRCSRKLQPFG